MRMTCVAHAFDRVEAALSTTRFDAAFAAFEAGLQASRVVVGVERGVVVEGGAVVERGAVVVRGVDVEGGVDDDDDAEFDRLDVAEVDKAVAAAVDGTA
jgi:hypothetical protein